MSVEQRRSPARPARASSRAPSRAEPRATLAADEPSRVDEAEPVSRASAPGPPPLPWTLLHPPPFERTVSIDGFLIGPDPGPLVPSFLAISARGWIAAAGDARLTGLGWTEAIALEQGLTVPRWAVSGRWAPPALSARPAPLGLGGPVVAEAPEGAAVSAPRGAWRVSGVLGGPVVADRLGVVLSLDASGLGLPPPEPGLAAGGRARQNAALTATWLPSAEDRVGLLVVAGRRTESPDCLRCTEAAARVNRALAALVGLSWTHAFAPDTGLELRLSAEHRAESAGASSPPPGPSHLDLSTWVTDGAPGTLGPDLAESALEATSTRARLDARLHSVLGVQRLEAGLEAVLTSGRLELSVPAGRRFLDRGGPCTPDENGGCAFRIDVEPAREEPRTWALGAFLEDALGLGDLLLRAGLRLDAALAAAGPSTGPRVGLGPRLALVWDVGGRGRHWLLLHAGRTHDVELGAVVRRLVAPVARVASWDGAAFDGCAQPGPSCVRLGGAAAIDPGGLPRSDEVALGWRGWLGSRLEGGLEGRLRHTTALWEEEEVGLVTDAEGRWTSLDGRWTSRRTVSANPRAWRRTLALGTWTRARVGPARVTASWSVARVTGTAAGPFDRWLTDARTAALADGPLPDDQRHRVSISLALQVHPGVEAGVRLRYATGGPLWETFTVPGAAGLRTVHGVRGTGLLASGAALLRDPDVLVGDAWLRVRLGALLPLGVPRLDLTLEAAQVAGGNAPVHVSASASRLGAVLRREPPFQLVLGLRAGN